MLKYISLSLSLTHTHTHTQQDVDLASLLLLGLAIFYSPVITTGYNNDLEALE